MSKVLPFYKKVCALCAKRGISKAILSKDTGIPESAISKWGDGGGVSNKNAKKIADYFGVTVDALINDDVLVNRIISDAPLPPSTGAEPMANCDALILAKDEAIATLKRESAQLHARLAEVNAAKEEAIALLRDRLADKDAERGRLIAEKDKRLDDKDRVIAEMERRAVVAERQVEELKLENSQLKNERKSAEGVRISNNSKISKSARVVV